MLSYIAQYDRLQNIIFYYNIICFISSSAFGLSRNALSNRYHGTICISQFLTCEFSDGFYSDNVQTFLNFNKRIKYRVNKTGCAFI